MTGLLEDVWTVDYLKAMNKIWASLAVGILSTEHMTSSQLHTWHFLNCTHYIVSTAHMTSSQLPTKHILNWIYHIFSTAHITSSQLHTWPDLELVANGAIAVSQFFFYVRLKKRKNTKKGFNYFHRMTDIMKKYFLTLWQYCSKNHKKKEFWNYFTRICQFAAICCNWLQF